MQDDAMRALLVRALGVQYDIGHLIGRGGMGAVFFARERALEREVAIKVLPPESAAHAPDSRERFRREARTAAQLQHSHIVPLYTFGEAEGLTFFIMGYVRGESLGARIKREGRLPHDDATRILRELADAVDYAHSKGVVHRDIKPDNVLLEHDTGRAMLTDFGIAKGATGGETLTRTGTVVGTPAYMSPEQAAGERNVDGRADLYAIGVLGYEMFAGRAVFSGGTVQEVLMQHVTQVPVQLQSVAPDAPLGAVTAIMRCLEKDPARRFADGKSLRAALDTDADPDDLIPDNLRGLAGYVPQFVIAAYVTILAEIGLAVRPDVLSDIRLLTAQVIGFTPVTMILGGAAMACVCHWRDKHAWPEIMRVMLQPPRWWRFPWPRRWSRPNVADRLPPEIKRWRRVMAWFVSCLMLVTAPAAVAAVFGPKSIKGPMGGLAIGAMLVGEIPWFFAWWQVVKWGKARGLGQNESTGLLNTGLASPFWKKPRIAAVLQPATPASRKATEPRTPDELLRAIAELSQHLAEPFREITGDAATTARDAADEMGVLDREIAALSAEANPAEIARIEERLAGLAPDSSLRPLLSNQLELLRSLAARIDALAQRRTRVVDILRTLWLQLANLRALRAADDPAASEITGRIRALCASVAHEISAQQETVQLLQADVPTLP